MSITEIAISNIKGIDHKALKVNLMPNKPNLLIAPNGFGKSSIATAFASMNRNRLDLADADHHKEDTNLAPAITITHNGTRLTADKTKNEIRKTFDVISIRSGLEAKATKRNMGRFTQVSASLEVQSILICKTPEKALFDYKYNETKQSFGKNGKILPNIQEILTGAFLLRAISNLDLSKITQQRNQCAINNILSSINQQTGTGEEICEWIKHNCINELCKITPLKELSGRLVEMGLSQSDLDGLLAAYQICTLYNRNKDKFNTACEWLNYNSIKRHYDELLADFCSSRWQWASLNEDKKSSSLYVTFPKAHQLSNGQRDLVTLVVQMHKTLYEGSTKPLILVIDEVFDYLDDANLVSFQYYVTSIIEAYKKQNQTVYPIILTHLDPGVFFDFCFNKHKIQINYLQAQPVGKAKDTLKLIEARDDQEQIKDRLEKHWFHFNNESCEIPANEWPKNIPENWRQSDIFHDYTKSELIRYLENKNYDPLAVCFCVRITIEMLAFNLLAQDEQKEKFLNEVKKTSNKMDYVASTGIDIPESYFLLGLIYNTNLHWNQGRDYISPLATKLNHPTIKQLITSVNQSQQ